MILTPLIALRVSIFIDSKSLVFKTSRFPDEPDYNPVDIQLFTRNPVQTWLFLFNSALMLPETNQDLLSVHLAAGGDVEFHNTLTPAVRSRRHSVASGLQYVMMKILDDKRRGGRGEG
jgi:hypothetical protein